MSYNIIADMSDPDDSSEPVSITTVDVYDIASDIGAECEHMIEKFGADSVSALLPKVINALELLEALAMRNEKENSTLRELTNKISQLEIDKVERAEYRQRFEKEIEAIEEQWRTESAELVTCVSRLQDENKRLRRAADADADSPPSPAHEHDQQVLSRLTSIAEKQRNTLRDQESMLQEKQHTIDSLTSQVERLNNMSRELRRKQKQLQNQMRSVCEERTELDAIVQAQQKDIAMLQAGKSGQGTCPRCATSPEGDADDPERPTYSVRELRAILQERNELKHRLHEAEEQLRALKITDDYTPPTLDGSHDSCEIRSDAPVQGPLPYEPDDAPWKRQHSGIGKFFRKFFADTDITIGTFPRRSFSTLASKMAAGPPTAT